MTDPPKNLTEALAMLQARLPRIKKDTPGQFGKYADLADVSLKLLPIMAELGLSFSSKPTLVTREDGTREFVLLYTLRHVSGEQDQGEYPLSQAGFPQQLGSAITYARRYTLTAITGAVADTDDDAEAAQEGARDRAPLTHKRRIERVHGRNATGDADEWASVDSNGERQPAGNLPDPRPPVNWIMQHFRRLGFKDSERAERLALTAHFAGFTGDLATTSELTPEQAKTVLKVLEKSRDRSHLEARYEAERAQALAESGDAGA